ncbi:MAG TPA: sugar phosphate isomerase/epimerase family protein [Pirellulales bacterium]|nr:sugar phosphate isomerase/epimerase family protein [Pirellulales bacterium]
MAQLSMNEMTTYRWSFEQDVAEYVAAGIRGIGVWRQKLADYGEEKGMELLAESGLEVSNLLWAGGFTGSDGRTLRESVNDALEAIRLAADLRAGCLVVYSGGRAGHTHNHVRRLVKEALAELLPAAAEHTVTLAIEPMHLGCAAEWTFLTSIDDALSLMDAFDSPWLKLAFDTYHFGQQEGIIEELAVLAPRIAVVHLGDCKAPPRLEQNRARLGDGKVPLKEIFATLSSAGYDGYYDVELMGEEIEISNYRDLLEQSKLAFSQLAGCPAAHR